MLNLIYFILSFIISLFLWIFIWIPFYILGFLLIWIGLLFCVRTSERMPILWWFWDNTPHGINGTLKTNGQINNMKWVYICNKPEIDQLPENKKYNFMVSLVESKTGKERTYKNRWVWCAWRNAVSNLSLYLIGLKVTKPIYPITKLIGNRIKIEKVTSGLGWFYSFMYKYNNERCLYLAFGWKFLDICDNRARFIFRISPWREIPR